MDEFYKNKLHTEKNLPVQYWLSREEEHTYDSIQELKEIDDTTKARYVHDGCVPLIHKSIIPNNLNINKRWNGFHYTPSIFKYMLFRHYTAKVCELMQTSFFETYDALHIQAALLSISMGDESNYVRPFLRNIGSLFTDIDPVIFYTKLMNIINVTQQYIATYWDTTQQSIISLFSLSTNIPSRARVHLFSPTDKGFAVIIIPNATISTPKVSEFITFTYGEFNIDLRNQYGLLEKLYNVKYTSKHSIVYAHPPDRVNFIWEQFYHLTTDIIHGFSTLGYNMQSNNGNMQSNNGDMQSNNSNNGDMQSNNSNNGIWNRLTLQKEILSSLWHFCIQHPVIFGSKEKWDGTSLIHNLQYVPSRSTQDLSRIYIQSKCQDGHWRFFAIDDERFAEKILSSTCRELLNLTSNEAGLKKKQEIIFKEVATFFDEQFENDEQKYVTLYEAYLQKRSFEVSLIKQKRQLEEGSMETSKRSCINTISSSAAIYIPESIQEESFEEETIKETIEKESILFPDLETWMQVLDQLESSYQQTQEEVKARAITDIVTTFAKDLLHSID